MHWTTIFSTNPDGGMVLLPYIYLSRRRRFNVWCYTCLHKCEIDPTIKVCDDSQSTKNDHSSNSTFKKKRSWMKIIRLENNGFLASKYFIIALKFKGSQAKNRRQHQQKWKQFLKIHSKMWLVERDDDFGSCVMT